jgi:hypothetical protein
MLEIVKYVPDLRESLFSIKENLKYGFHIEEGKVMMKVTKGKTTLLFHLILRTKIGLVSGVNVTPMIGETDNSATKTRKEEINWNIDITNFHNILGHCREDKQQKLLVMM